MNMTDRRRVEERAYAIWDAEGQPHGRHEEHWQLAERELAAEKAGPAAKPKRRRAVASPAAAAMPAGTLRRKPAAALTA